MPVVIVGAGGHAKVVCDALLASGLSESELRGFVDDQPDKWGGRVLGFPILGGVDSVSAGEVHLAMAIGDNAARQRAFENAKRLGHKFINVIHPQAVVGRECRFGEGIVVFAQAVVNSGTEIGDGVIVNTACSVDHDCRIGAHAHIAPGARLAGGVSVGEGALIGIGAVAIPGISIGARSVVGAGAAVTRDLPPDCVAVGVPARVIKIKEKDG